MFVRQLIGRQVGAIVEMPFEAAQAGLAAGTVAAVSDAEIAGAGLGPVAGMEEVPPEKLLEGYRIEPSASGTGFDLFDAGGVPLNQAPIHNHAAARDLALEKARAARGLAPAGTEFDPLDHDKNGRKGGSKPAGDDAETVWSARDLLDSVNAEPPMEWNEFKVAAHGILGDDTPSKKVDIVAALEARAKADAAADDSDKSE